jgi:hypothetical protein
MALAKYSIGAKIFGAFAAMSAIIGLTGLAGYGVLSVAGNIAVTTFDGPLMAINYARAAHTDFTEMQLAELRFEHAAPRSPGAELRFEHAAPGERAAISADISDIAATFSADLEVAAQRSLAEDEQRMIAQIRPLVARWREARTRGDTAQL